MSRDPLELRSVPEYLAEIPRGAVPVPDRVRWLAGGDEIEAVWVNELGGVTFRLGAGTRRDRHVKWSPSGSAEIDLKAEAERLGWAARWLRVPHVLDGGDDGAHSWLVTETIAGSTAVCSDWVKHPEVVVPAIGRGLRHLHDALPVEQCPYTWSVDDRMVRFEERLREGATPDEWMPEHRSLAPSRVRELLATPPPIDRLVVCHGDACAPNTLVDDLGAFTAHVDLGHVGLADRWADLAVASWSIGWNYGAGYEHLLFAGYGIEPDDARVAYYRLLWDVT